MGDAVDRAMPKEAAVEFFSDFYRGKHHVPTEIRPWGDGWEVRHSGGRLCSWDFNDLTRLVLLAHDRCVRVDVTPCNMRYLRIAIWQRRTREGRIDTRHPTMEQVLADWREHWTADDVSYV